jgi:trans-2-enoyl-CoA reductase
VPIIILLGCWIDFAVLKAEELIKIPDKWTKLPVEVLATINVNPPTAYRLLKDFVALKKGDLIVQNGANSAVGRLAIQMASIMGVRTLNVVRDRSDFEELTAELCKLDPNGGATVVKAEELKDLCGFEPVLGLNCVGGGAVSDMAKIMAKDGVIVTYGAMSRRPLTIPASALIFKNLTFKGFWITSWYQEIGAADKKGNAERAQMLDAILNWYSDGRLKPVKSFWLDVKETDAEIKELIRDSWEGKASNKGKCILRFI